MIKILVLIIFLLIGAYSLKAAENPESDEAFIKELDQIKNPFEDGLPKPVIVVPQAVYQPARPTVIAPKPPPPPPPEPIVLPDLKLKGVMVGDDMHEAIINDQVVPLLGTIEGAEVISVAKEGIVVVYKDKKFFLKVD